MALSPLSRDYGAGTKATHASTEYGPVGDHEEEYWFHLGTKIRFAVGFLGIVGPLLSSRTWRRYTFGFENMWYKILDCSFNFKYMVPK